MSPLRVAPTAFVVVAILLSVVAPVGADTSAQPPPFSQDWSNTALITVDDDWSGVPGVIGYRGDDLTTATGTNPQTITADGSATPVDVNANQTNPNTFATGGVAEFHLTDPSVALNGSGTADAPHIVVTLATSGLEDVVISYVARDLDGSLDNAVQALATQSRVGNSGAFTDLPAGFVADATQGPSISGGTTPVSVTLPADADDKPLVQVRVMTTNAAGNDEWVGIDSITATGTPIVGDSAPAVSDTSPAGGATNVPLDSDVTITFSEAVDVTGSWFDLECTESGSHTASASGGPMTFTLAPDVDFDHDETCTLTVSAGQVSDQDLDDPPDTMAADFSASFTTLPIPATIQQIQGASHLSPLVGRRVSGVEGIVTARRIAGGRGVWIEDPAGDGDLATSDGVFVFTSATPAAQVGDSVRVSGTVTEFRGGCADPCTPAAGSGFNNLTITQITSSNPNVQVLSSNNPLPGPTVLGDGGRKPPTETIDDDATSTRDVEVANDFEPSDDAIDFYESLEGMTLRIDPGAAVVGPTKSFGEITVLPNGGSWATGRRTPRGGILYAYADGNPERMHVDDEILRDLITPRPGIAMPNMDVGAVVTNAIVGPLDYTFANYKIQATTTPTFQASTITREVATTPRRHELAVATFNVENLTVRDPASKFAELASMIVQNLRAPDLIGIEEVQDDDGTTDSGNVDASQTWARLIAAIEAVGGPTYQYRQIDPVNNADGGAPGGNIRVGFLFRTDRGLSFVDRPGGDAVTPTAVVPEGTGRRVTPSLTLSPGRIDPANPAYADTRKSLAGEFRYQGQKLFAVVVHFSSKGSDQPLFGRFQPPTRFSEEARHGQAEVVNDFVEDILAIDRRAKVIVLGDINDFEFSETVDILEGDGDLTTFMRELPRSQRYSYVFEGNSQTLDQILGSDTVLDRLVEYDVVRVNAEFAVQASDHDPSVARVRLPAGDDDDDDDD